MHVSWLKFVWTKDVCKPSTGPASPLAVTNRLVIKRDSGFGTLGRFFSNQAGNVLRSCFLGGSSLSRFPLTWIPPSVWLSLESASTAFCDVWLHTSSEINESNRPPHKLRQWWTHLQCKACNTEDQQHCPKPLQLNPSKLDFRWHWNYSLIST